MLYKINGGLGGLILSIILIVLNVTWYILYCRHLGKKYILKCSVCGHSIKKKFIFVINQSHSFYRTYCDHCHIKEYFTAIEDKEQ